jgi:hypothetical protein
VTPATQPSLPEYRSRGARALVVLHERELRAFVAVWRRAKAAGVLLPHTEDPGYASLEHLLRHVLRAARGYMTWTCEQLALPDPDIRATPEADALVGELDGYLEHVCLRWRTPLAGVPVDALEPAAYPSRWKSPYSIDAMLEHAVMHPIRHGLQLEGLLERT